MQSVDFFDDRDDADLLTRARSGDTRSADVLWVRVRPSVLAVARGIADNQHDAEDLASEAMTKVFTAIAGGHGPTDAILPYLYATVRNLHVSTLRRQARVGTPLQLTEQRVLNLVRPEPDAIESELVTRAFKSLPQRWRFVLWACLVEGRPGHETAAELGIKPAAVHALKSRALEGLRQQYLSEHARLSEEQECAEVHRVLASIARGRPRRSTDLNQVWRHLRACEHCAEGYREISAINNRIGALLGPAAATLVGLAPQHASVGAAALDSLRLPAAGQLVAAAGVAGILAIAGSTMTLGEHRDAAAPQRAVSAAAPSVAAGPATVRSPVAPPRSQGSSPAPAAPSGAPCLPVSLDPDDHLAPVAELDALPVEGRLKALTPEIPEHAVAPASCLAPEMVGTATRRSDPAAAIARIAAVDTAKTLLPRGGRVAVPVPAPELPSLPALDPGLP